MSEQNFSNHTRLHPAYHFVAAPLSLIGLIGSIVNFLTCDASQHYSASLLVVLFVLVFMCLAFVRLYALKAQDRAIRAEEKLRHFILTGKPLPSGLRTGQIIALRFASDEEFPALAQKAVAENMKSKEIKQAINNWKADHYRI